jgi:hypothetical protein
MGGVSQPPAAFGYPPFGAVGGYPGQYPPGMGGAMGGAGGGGGPAFPFFAFGPPPPGGMGGQQAMQMPIVPARMESATTLKNNFNLHKASLQLVPAAAPSSSSSSGGASTLFAVRFVFDAALPCTVSLFFVAVEQPPTQEMAGRPLADRLITKFPSSGAKFPFPAGLRQQFDALLLLPDDPKLHQQQQPTADPSSEQQSLIDVRLYTPEELVHVPPSLAAPSRSLSASAAASSLLASVPVAGSLVPAGSESVPIPPSMFPLVIVIEGLAHQPSLGGGGDVQLQATYATLVPAPPVSGPAGGVGGGGGGAGPAPIGVKVLQQKIQVGSSVYVLKELFGVESGGAGGGSGSGSASASSSPTKGAPSSSSSDPATSTSATSPPSPGDPSRPGHLLDPVISGGECVICLTERRTTAILPCRHTCLCADCAAQLRMQTNKCPICRTPVTSLLTISALGGGGADGAGGAKAL